MKILPVLSWRCLVPLVSQTLKRRRASEMTFLCRAEFARASICARHESIQAALSGVRCQSLDFKPDSVARSFATGPLRRLDWVSFLSFALGARAAFGRAASV